MPLMWLAAVLEAVPLQVHPLIIKLTLQQLERSHTVSKHVAAQ